MKPGTRRPTICPWSALRDEDRRPRVTCRRREPPTPPRGPRPTSVAGRSSTPCTRPVDRATPTASSRPPSRLPSAQRFGVHPGQIPALLHEVYATAEAPPQRARLAAALARAWAYGGDTSRATVFATEAESLAAAVADPELVADALDARLLSLWGPDDFGERLRLAARLNDAAAHVADPEVRLLAHLWRLTTAWECLDIVAVQRQLRALDVLAEETGSPRVAFFAVARRAMHALATSDLTLADTLIARTVEAGSVAEPDVAAVLHSLIADRARQTDDTDVLFEQAASFEAFGVDEGVPSVTAEAAVLWLAAGEAERAAALARQLAGEGLQGVARDVDFLLTTASLVDVAVAAGIDDITSAAVEALAPYAGRAILNAGAVTFHGVVDDYLYRAHRALGQGEADRYRHGGDELRPDRRHVVEGPAGSLPAGTAQRVPGDPPPPGPGRHLDGRPGRLDGLGPRRQGPALHPDPGGPARSRAHGASAVGRGPAGIPAPACPSRAPAR